MLDQLWVEADVSSALLTLQHPWYDGSSPGRGPLRVAAPVVPGHGPATVLAYAPVPYEDYDFAAAEPAPEAPGALRGGELPGGGYVTQAEVGPQDLDDGRVTVSVTDGNTVAARITTEGGGRMRFLLDGRPADALGTTDGWWSSWTAARTSSEVELSYPDFRPRERELTIVVEDYEDFTVEVLSG